jgi:hypothetical protein
MASSSKKLDNLGGTLEVEDDDALRRQIKKNKDALERDDLELQNIKANVANLTDISFETLHLHRVLKKEVTPQTSQLKAMNGSHDGFKQVKIDSDFS